MHPFILKNIIHFLYIIIIIIIIITILTTCLYNFTDNTDFANVPNDTKLNRFVALFYYNSSIHGGLGDALIYPISKKARIYTSIYLIIIAGGILTAIINF